MALPKYSEDPVVWIGSINAYDPLFIDNLYTVNIYRSAHLSPDNVYPSTSAHSLS